MLPAPYGDLCDELTGCGVPVMRVYAKLCASLRKHLPPDAVENRVLCELRDGATVADLIGRLGLPSGNIGIIVADDAHLDMGSPLSEGIEISIFPPLAGGVPDRTVASQRPGVRLQERAAEG